MELESAGEIVTGALVATAVDGVTVEGLPHDGHCLNCGASLYGSFCNQCGQNAHVHRSITAFWHDFLHAFMHFDGKVWRTLPMLMIRPGQLTRRYVQGERAKFVSPMALFLFSVFMMFAVFGTFGGPVENNFRMGNEAAENASLDMKAELARARAELTKLKAERLRATGAAAEALDGRITAITDELTELRTAATVAGALGTGSGKANRIDTGNPGLDAKLNHALENPALLLYKMQSNSYKFSWLIIPLSLPFLWGLFALRRDIWPFDHLVFITYSICFMSLLLILITLLGKVGGLRDVAESLIFILPPLHMFVQLKGAYQLSKRGALWRTIVLLAAALIVIGLFAVAIAVIGLG